MLTLQVLNISLLIWSEIVWNIILGQNFQSNNQFEWSFKNIDKKYSFELRIKRIFDIHGRKLRLKKLLISRSGNEYLIIFPLNFEKIVRTSV